jgi:hypothetical protein
MRRVMPEQRKHNPNEDLPVEARWNVGSWLLPVFWLTVLILASLVLLLQ